ncbi:MAG TPA: methyltransferase [Thermoplasmata archaeon]|nr:methyltransferase [Thermoplasmata archaeon]
MTKDVPREPLELLTQGFQQFRVLATAVDLRLFSLLPARGAAVPDVASMLGFEERPTRILLTALTSMGLLEKRGSRYRTTPLSRMYLVEGRPAYYGDFVQMMDRRLYDAYRRLDRSLGTNRPVTADPAIGDLFRTMAQDPAMVRLFTSGMHATGTYWADALAKSYDFSRHRVLLDVGGGSGVYAITIAKRHRRLRATVFDLPGVLEIAREKIREAGLESRITTVAGDFFKDEWPTGADVILFSSVLHDWSPDTSKKLLRRAAEILPTGGVVVVRELFMNDDGGGPLYAAMSSVTMLLETEGENYSWSTYESWLRAAGFDRFRRIPFRTTAASGALIARKA